MQISIIIPIYNTVDLLPKCIDSAINQTYRDLQIILVNDGSKDSSLFVCSEYKDSDNRIVVIDKENGGLSDARNAGLAIATGDYVMFLDSDDYIDIDACQNFVDSIGSKKPDIVTANAKRIEDNEVTKIIHSITDNTNIIPAQSFLLQELKNNSMNMAVWLNLYSLSFLNKNNLQFKKGIYHEDELFTPIAFLSAESVLPTDIIYYNYIIRENSITKNKNYSKKANDVLSICKHLDEVYKNIGDVTLKNYLYDHMVNFYLNIFQTSKLYKRKYRYFIDKELLIGKGQTRVNKARIMLFRISPVIYYMINEIRRYFI